MFILCVAKKTKIIDRIRFINALISSERFEVLTCCRNVSDALCQAVWDSSCQGDVRLDDGYRNIDSLDALEYAAEPYMKEMMSVS